ncbi:MAG: cytochrome c-type biogenesis protein [Myxococcaceae bacterium]
MKVLLLLTLLSSTTALAEHAMMKAGTEFLDPQREARVQALSKKFRCPVCQGTSIADSNSSMAVAQVDVVRRMVAEGKTDEEIRDYFVARYGEWTLLEPKVEGFNLLVWLGPAVVLIFGLWMISMQIKKVAPNTKGVETHTAESKPPEAAAPPAELSTYLDKVRQEAER